MALSNLIDTLPNVSEEDISTLVSKVKKSLKDSFFLQPSGRVYKSIPASTESSLINLSGNLLALTGLTHSLEKIPFDVINSVEPVATSSRSVSSVLVNRLGNWYVAPPSEEDIVFSFSENTELKKDFEEHLSLLFVMLLTNNIDKIFSTLELVSSSKEEILSAKRHEAPSNFQRFFKFEGTGL